MITNKELLEWVDKNIEKARRNAMHAYKRGDTLAFEYINNELKCWSALADVITERVKENDDVDA